MAEDLRARLSRIRELRRGVSGQEPAGERESASGTGGEPGLLAAGWVPAGLMTLSRTEIRELPVPVPRMPPRDLGILAPGFNGFSDPASLLFFDLETTGLSGGAGTLAFLAAFGRLVKTGAAGLDSGSGSGPSAGSGFCGISLTQYLLLDYPGEGDFLEAVRGEFPGRRAVSYNGRNFDAQILRNRWLMNGIVPPDYVHEDLLYPARRLWKGVLPDCSQGTIEREILGISRDGDVAGAFAPEIWFNFLRNAEAGPLLKICDHNLRDILGLASLFACLCAVASEPRNACGKYRADGERLALLWSYAARQGRADPELARDLLEAAAKEGYPRACRLLAIELEWGRGIFSGLSSGALHKDPARDLGRALTLAECALGHGEGKLGERARKDLEKRRERLLKKLGRTNDGNACPADEERGL